MVEVNSPGDSAVGCFMAGLYSVFLRKKATASHCRDRSHSCFKRPGKVHSKPFLPQQLQELSTRLLPKSNGGVQQPGALTPHPSAHCEVQIKLHHTNRLAGATGNI